MVFHVHFITSQTTPNRVYVFEAAVASPPSNPPAPPMNSTTGQISVDRSLVSGIAWTAVLRWGAQLFSWIATFYAAHRLAPSDYGLVSMATIGIGLARIVEDFGIDSIL